MSLIIALIFLLGTIVTSSALGEQAPATAAQTDINGGLKTALNSFKTDVGRYPTSAEGLNALVQCPTNLTSGWKGPYLATLPIDPWENAYVYASPGLHNRTGYDLYSCGEDGVSTSHGSDPDDINNWYRSSPHVVQSYTSQLWQWHPLLVSPLMISMFWVAWVMISTFTKKKWWQLLLVLWFSPIFLIILHHYLRFPPYPNLNFPDMVLWCVAGLGFSLAGLWYGSRDGRFASLVFMVELFGLAIFLFVPEINSCPR